MQKTSIIPRERKQKPSETSSETVQFSYREQPCSIAEGHLQKQTTNIGIKRENFL